MCSCLLGFAVVLVNVCVSVSVFMIIFESTSVKYSVFLGGREVVGGTHPFALNKAQEVTSFP